MTFLILVIGDLHIPDRALDIPAKVNAQNQETGQLGPALYPGGERMLSPSSSTFR